MFFFHDTATAVIYTYLHPLSLHDALPICRVACAVGAGLASLLAFALLWSKRADVFGGETEVQTLTWLPDLGLNLSLRLDGLGFLFALLILGIDRKSTRLNSSH